MHQAKNKKKEGKKERKKGSNKVIEIEENKTSSSCLAQISIPVKTIFFRLSSSSIFKNQQVLFGIEFNVINSVDSYVMVCLQSFELNIRYHLGVTVLMNNNLLSESLVLLIYGS